MVSYYPNKLTHDMMLAGIAGIAELRGLLSALEDDIKRGITPIFVPDNDADHAGSVYDKEEKNDTPALFKQ